MSDVPPPRAPLSWLAVFFRPACRWWLGGVLLVLIGIGLWLDASSAQAENLPASPGRSHPKPLRSSTVKLGGVAYTEARACFEKLGFEGDFEAKTSSLTLTQGDGAAAARLEFGADKREARINGMRVFLGEPAALHKSAIYIANIDLDRFLLPILRGPQLVPRPVRTIVIDAGHGGDDSGTVNKEQKLNEKTHTLDVALRLQRLLSDEGWRVLLTRTADTFVELPARAAFANEAKADLFISIHFNAVANNPAVRGTETYVLTPQFERSTSSLKAAPEDRIAHPGNQHDAWSAILGYHMQRELLAKLKSEDRGYKHARFAVLRLVDCPAVLVEAGYLSNETEAKKIANEDYRRDIAEALYAAIQAYAAAQNAATAGAMGKTGPE